MDPAPRADLLVLDEIELILNQFKSKVTMKDFANCWMILKHLVRTAKRVIRIDAIYKGQLNIANIAIFLCEERLH
jgi:Origin of replication binding protein